MGRLRRGLNSLLLILAGLSPVLWCTAVAMARAGGGEGFGGGGGGGGSGGGGGGGGGGGDLFLLIYYWFRFCILYPYIGWPITAIVILFFIHSARTAKRMRHTSIIRRGSPLIDAFRARAAAETLRAADPHFDEQRFGQRVGAAFEKIQRAWCAQDMSPARPFISDGVFERFSLQIDEQRALGWRDVMDQLQVLDVALAEVSRGGVFTTATCRIRAAAANYRVSIADNSRVSGSTSPEEFAEYWTFLRRSDAQTVARDGLIEGRCPNCGAGIEMNRSAICPQCHSLLLSGRYDWVLVEITQECEWQPGAGPAALSSPSPGASTPPSPSPGTQAPLSPSPGTPGEGWGGGPPGLDELRQRDPELTLAEIEDRASVLYWRWITSQRTGDLSLLARAADPNLLQQWHANLDAQKQAGPMHTWLGECAVGSVETQGFIAGAPGSKEAESNLDRAIVLVRWMGTQFEQQVGNGSGGRGSGGRGSRRVEPERSSAGASPSRRVEPESSSAGASPSRRAEPIRGQRSQIMQTVLVLSRAAGSTSDADRGVSSAHCPKCGAPETGGDKPTCPYCWTVLNDGQHGWVLHDLQSAASPKGRQWLSDTAGTDAPIGQAAPSSVAQLLWMARMASSDGTIDDQERQLIEQFAQRRGIPPARVSAMIAAAQSGDGELPAPANPQEARQWLEAMIATGLSDGRIASQEMKLFQSAATRAGLSDYDLRMILAQHRSQLLQAARNALRDKRLQR